MTSTLRIERTVDTIFASISPSITAAQLREQVAAAMGDDFREGDWRAAMWQMRDGGAIRFDGDKIQITNKKKPMIDNEMDHLKELCNLSDEQALWVRDAMLNYGAAAVMDSKIAKEAVNFRRKEFLLPDAKNVYPEMNE